jgi:glyoxylase-like metal-dependent hydrolase (beta-lactamase superfamily II)
MITRRTLLHASLAVGASAAIPWSRCARATPGKPALEAQRLATDLWLLAGAGGNVVAAGGGDGLLLVDAGARDRTAELLSVLDAQTGGHRVATLFNTHWHWDHTGGNEVLAQAGATIIAHENTRLWLTEPVISRWEHRTYPPLPKGALPTQTFFDSRPHPMSFGSRALEYGHLGQAHTDGDIYVFFPDANVLVAGDVVSGGGYPIADYCSNGWLGGMITALKTLLARSDGQTRIIPGSGPARTREDLSAQLDMCFEVLSRIADNYYKGQTWDELVASGPTKAFDARWGNPDLFLQTAYEGAWLHINEIRRVSR